MTFKNIFKKKAINFMSYESFSQKEDFRANLIFSQKCRRQNIKNMSF